MNTPKVVTHAGVTLDLAQVKCFKLSPFTLSDSDASDQIVIELKPHLTYVFNPSAQKWQLEVVNDTIVQPFSSYDQAVAYLREWEEIWQLYLSEKA